MVDAVGEGVDAALAGPAGVGVGGGLPASGRHRAGVRRSCRPGRWSCCRSGASFDLGASLGVPFLTAHRALTVTEGGPTAARPRHAHRPDRPGGRRCRRGRQRRHPARPVGRRDRASPRSAARRRPSWPRPPAPTTSSTTGGRTSWPRSARSPRDGVHTIVEVVPGRQRRHRRRGARAPTARSRSTPTTAATTVDAAGPRRRWSTNARWQFVLLYTVPAAAKARARRPDVTAAVLDGAGPGRRRGRPAAAPLHRWTETAARPRRGRGLRRRQGADRRHRLSRLRGLSRRVTRLRRASRGRPGRRRRRRAARRGRRSTAPARCVAASTTGGATPSSCACSQRSATTHQRSPGCRPGKRNSGRGVDRSLPTARWWARNSAVTTAQTVWLPTSCGPLVQQPSR